MIPEKAQLPGALPVLPDEFHHAFPIMLKFSARDRDSVHLFCWRQLKLQVPALTDPVHLRQSSGLKSHQSDKELQTNQVSKKVLCVRHSKQAAVFPDAGTVALDPEKGAVHPDV